jgi:hypothetical protein
VTARTPEGYRIEQCRTCEAQIIWATTGKKNIPVDLEPTAKGNVELTSGSRGRAPVATVHAQPPLGGDGGLRLTTLDVDCWTCQGRHRNRGSRG